MILWSEILSRQDLALYRNVYPTFLENVWGLNGIYSLKNHLVSLQNLGVAKELLIFEIFFEFSFCDVFLTKFLFKLSTYPSK